MPSCKIAVTGRRLVSSRSPPPGNARILKDSVTSTSPSLDGDEEEDDGEEEGKDDDDDGVVDVCPRL